MTTLFGSLATGISGIGSSVPAHHRPTVRDELMWRWKQQFLRRPFNLKLRSGRFAAHSVLLPASWTPDKGTLLPLGEVRHLVMARRLNKGMGAVLPGGHRVPFWVPLLELTPYVSRTVHHPIVIGGSAGLRAQFDLALTPRRGIAPGLVLPRANTRLLEAALNMEEALIDAATGRRYSSGPPLLPTYLAAFEKGPEGAGGHEVVEETRAAVQLTLQVLAGNGVLPEGLISPGGVVLDVTEEEGWRVVSFVTNGDGPRKVVSRFLPPSAILQPFVTTGTEIERGTRIAYYATPRHYPSWRAVQDGVLKYAAHDVLSDVVRSLDVESGGHVFRDVRLCPAAVRTRRHAAIFEDVQDMLDQDGIPKIHTSPYAALFTEFTQNGATFRADVWSRQAESCFAAIHPECL
jgi:hypothetical protein